MRHNTGKREEHRVKQTTKASSSTVLGSHANITSRKRGKTRTSVFNIEHRYSSRLPQAVACLTKANNVVPSTTPALANWQKLTTFCSSEAEIDGSFSMIWTSSAGEQNVWPTFVALMVDMASTNPGLPWAGAATGGCGGAGGHAKGSEKAGAGCGGGAAATGFPLAVRR